MKGCEEIFLAVFFTVIIVSVAVILFALGAMFSQDVIEKKCNQFGEFRTGEFVYSCDKKVKL